MGRWYIKAVIFTSNLMANSLEVILAQPRGFCAGVERAIKIVEEALKQYGPPVYVRHEIVHNKYVVDDLKRKGAIFVKEVEEVPTGEVVIFSAHGVAKQVEDASAKRQLQILDATCPLVRKVHLEAIKQEKSGNTIILIGHENHPEIIGTSGRLEQQAYLVQTVEDVAELEIVPGNNLYYVTQTTLSVDETKEIIKALRQRFPHIQGPDTKDICYATQNRQDAVRELAAVADTLLVIGAQNSSNSNRLRDLGEQLGIRSYLITGPQDIEKHMIANSTRVVITSGASAPEILVEQTLDKLASFAKLKVSTMAGKEESITFKLPKELIS
jgi:4-hydroxy-3-methylbut-2-enyl diphosphate reductase